MTKSIRSRKKAGSEEGAVENGAVANGGSVKQTVGQLMKLAADEFSATQAAQERISQLAAADSNSEKHSSDVRAFPMKQRFSAPQAAREAAKQLAELTNLKFDSVSAVDKKETGWHVTVNVVELSRIPHSTDVLGVYEVDLDAEGNLEGYRRGPRYLRDQTGDSI
jgi:Gas vesicle synthesis protein GvpO